MVERGERGGSKHGKGPKSASSVDTSDGRLRFTVELCPEETTIVSWTKLLREANLSDSSCPESSTCPSFEAPPPATIERTERIHESNGSSDKEDHNLDNVPDDDEYDTEDSFIDDTELESSFQVDNSVLKHDGSVDCGKLECADPIIPTDQQPRKRGLKDLTKGGGSDDGRTPQKIMKKGHTRKTSSMIQRSPNAAEASRIQDDESELQAQRPNDGKSHRYLKLIAEMGSSAKQEKDDLRQKIKHEVEEMFEPHAANSVNFQEVGPEEREVLKHKYINGELENKICDLYDLYVEGLEEDLGPPAVRLYEEIALLWPYGC